MAKWNKRQIPPNFVHTFVEVRNISISSNHKNHFLIEISSKYHYSKLFLNSNNKKNREKRNKPNWTHLFLWAIWWRRKKMLKKPIKPKRDNANKVAANALIPCDQVCSHFWYTILSPEETLLWLRLIGLPTLWSIMACHFIRRILMSAHTLGSLSLVRLKFHLIFLDGISWIDGEEDGFYSQQWWQEEFHAFAACLFH